MSSIGLIITKKNFLFLPQHLWDVGALRIRPKDISSEEQRRGSASATYFSVFAYAAFAFQVALISDFGEELAALHSIPDAWEGLGFDVAEAVGVVVAAGDGVAVFCYAHEFAKEASPKKEVVKPVVPVSYTTLLRDPRKRGIINVDVWLTFVDSAKVVEFVPSPFVLGRGGAYFEAGWVFAVGNHAVVNDPPCAILLSQIQHVPEVRFVNVRD